MVGVWQRLAESCSSAEFRCGIVLRSGRGIRYQVQESKYKRQGTKDKRQETRDKIKMSLHEKPLEQEDQDAVILDARAGDLESLQEIFTTLIHPKLLATCVSSDNGSTALHMAAANGHLEVVKYIMEQVKQSADAGAVGRYVNLQNKTGNTALHWATLNGKLDVVQYLCDECDADPFVKNEFGHDPIFEAENNGKEEVENYFLKKFDVEPESESESEDDVKVSHGTEIEQVTKEATEVLAKQTESLQLE